MKISKKQRKYTAIVCVIIAIIVCAGGIAYILFRPTEFYQTTDIANYGVIIGNCDNKTPAAYINSFFPAEISQEYSDVVYSYRAENADTYGYEAYLEFKIENAQEFKEFIMSIAPENEWKEFKFDADYMEYCLDDKLLLSEKQFTSQSGKLYYRIQSAQVGKVLCSFEKQKVIFVAIGVFDGGGADTLFLSVFFNRFDIEPAQYEEFAKISY